MTDRERIKNLEAALAASDAALGDALVEANRLHEWLAEAVDELEDMVPYVPDYFRDKWRYDQSIAAIKAALHAKAPWS